MRRIVLGLLLVASGCNYEAPSEITCSSGEMRDGYTCVGGYWVSTGAQDMSMKDSGADITTTLPDMATDGETCTSPTALQFCAALGKNCGSVMGTDACGDERTEECGTCIVPDTCQADNTCTCAPEGEAEFCERLGKDCDDVTAPDNCGATRTVNCGMCEDGIACGEDAPNICGCPCLIDGACVAEDIRNPLNQCEVCDSAASSTAWTLAVGATCNDQDMCTVTDVCDAAGACAGTAKDCSGSSDVCKIGQCDAANGNCVAVNTPDQTACTDDSLTCTADVCLSGACEHNQVANTCLIDGACVAAAATRSTNVCEACVPAVSTTTWSPNNGAACNDGVSCTVSDTCSNRACAGTLDGCFISSSCVAEGATRDSTSCFVCDSSSNSTTYTALAAGADCPTDDGLACTSQTCAADGSCATTISALQCVIDGACVAATTENPANPCQVCNPIISQIAWSNRVDGAFCPGAGCSCRSGSCEKMNHTTCP